MWLSRRPRRDGRGGALTGTVTVPGQSAGVWLEGERRGVTVYAPGGYHWAPELGDEVLVLKTGESGEKTCAAGVPVEGTVKPGEVLITGRKCSLRLGLDGTVFVTGLLVVNGTQVGPPPPDDREG
ncbi:hypothetical protein [Vermiculatibacterium agrestimuris]|uniref:hypothetical protein n=1 Tax=Vermiculatibacterium agrestimuris TaxID=2941519 RepID=UPI002041A092|nr:hypothetical protein [Vermiculatibacterium agrestimuris]